MSHTKKKPMHLEPSKLGTKEYWDELYTNEISNHAHDPSDTGTVWFDDSDAEAKIIEFLSSPAFRSSILLPHPSPPPPPSSSSLGEGQSAEQKISFLDLGTGNGSLLFGLRDAEAEEDEDGDGDGEKRYRPWGRMLGVDYSARSVELARRIERERCRGETRKENDTGNSTPAPKDDAAAENEAEEPEVRFQEHDILRGSPAPLLTGPQSRGWDVVLDKGTFDAVSLSAETINNMGHRASEVYRARVLPLVRPGGVFLVTSCNWTEEELRGWFEGEEEEGEEDGIKGWGFEVAGRVAYPSFSFGGVKGQTISTLCFRKVRRGIGEVGK
ncbi:putative S-adenosylmethionine-dependent methyltransferase of the seven beta-strand family [Camillea tinctor]|nr:putative S-adenosylmethionine-dependent methyltransferase of the seven beta-strand family [Camillea tinctor]